MQANGTPQNPSIAIALFSEQYAEESETTKEQKQFQAGEVKPGVHKAENHGLQIEGAAVAQQQAQLAEQPAAEQQLFGKANPQAQHHGIEHQGRRQTQLALGAAEQQGHHNDQQQCCGQQHSTAQGLNEFPPAAAHTEAFPGLGFTPGPLQAPRQ